MPHVSTTPNSDVFDKLCNDGIKAFEGGRFEEAKINLVYAADAMDRMARSAPDAETRDYKLSFAGKLLELAQECDERKNNPEHPSRQPNPDNRGGAHQKPGRHEAPPSSQQRDDNAFDPSTLIHAGSNVSMNDIVGLERAKSQISRRMINPFRDPELWERLNLKAGGTVLLYGPPGTGKTMLAAAAAKEVDAAFYNVSASTLITKWVGEAEQNVKRLFDHARSNKRAVVFLDDAEKLLSGKDSTGVMGRVLGEFLTNMDGIKQKGRAGSNANALLVILATNKPWDLEEAAGSRFQAKIYVALPDHQARKAQLELSMVDIPLSDDVDFDEIARRTENYSGRELANISEGSRIDAAEEALRTQKPPKVTQGMLLNQLKLVKPVAQTDMVRTYEVWTSDFGTKDEER